MEQIKQTFVKAREQNRAALVPYITAGYPTAKETPDILLRLESSGAGVSIYMYPMAQSRMISNVVRVNRYD